MATAFTPMQLEVLASICDAAYQGYPIDSPAGKEILNTLSIDFDSQTEERKEQIHKFISTPFSSHPDALAALESQFFSSLSETNVSQLAMTLTILSTRAGTLLLTGHRGLFVNLSVEQREKVLQSWRESRLLLLRKAFRGFVTITLFVAYNSITTNALAIGYPVNGDPLAQAQARPTPPHHDYKFLTIPSTEGTSTDYPIIRTNILIVGSGAGAGVVHHTLSSLGHSGILMIEKGGYKPVQALQANNGPKEGLKDLYENGGLMITEDGSLSVLAGSCFGGGTTVNWSASFRTPHFIRSNWAKEHGLGHFLSGEFEKSLDYVCAQMGVSDEALVHNVPNEKLVEGSKKLGYHVEKIPQNTNRSTHSCGFCSFGCPFSEKQSGPVNWLKPKSPAAEGKFMVDTNVEKLLFASSRSSTLPTSSTLGNFTPSSSRKVCIGALISTVSTASPPVKTYSIVLASQAVVLSAGSLNSPAVLLRSGLKNDRVGRNLRLHPVTFITGYYDQVVNPWEGSIMTAVSNVRENIDGSHHGVKLEVNMSFPGGSAASFQPWEGSQEHKTRMLGFNNGFTLIAICRDRGSGRLVLDSSNPLLSRIEYALAPYDGLSLLAGIIAGASIHLAAGANRIVTSQVGVPDYCPKEGHKGLVDEEWLKWIALVERVGVSPSKIALGSAHQMGSCQMGTNPTKSVVDPRGRVWGTESLYIADASVFPTASAVNPMITNMATSHSIAQFIDQDLKAATNQPVRAQL